MKLINGHTKQSVKDAILRYVPDSGCMVQETGTCMYQLFDDYGCEARCAVGAFIPDGHKALEDIGTALDILTEYPTLSKYMPLKGEDLLRMQMKHDNAASSSAVVSVVDELFEWIDENIEETP